MARIKQVMLALRVTRKTAHAMIGTQRFKLFLTSGEQLMRINLMADVKDKLVRRTVKRPVQRFLCCSGCVSCRFPRETAQRRETFPADAQPNRIRVPFG